MMEANSASIASVRMDEFQNTVTDFGTELNSLRERIASAALRKNNLQSTLDQLKAETTELSAELNVIRGQEVEENERENFHQATVANLNEKLQVEKSKLEDIRDKNEAIQEEITEGVSDFECRSRDLLMRFQNLQLVEKQVEEIPTEIVAENDVREMEEQVEELETRGKNLSVTAVLDLPIDLLKDLMNSVRQKAEQIEEKKVSLQKDLFERQQTYKKLGDVLK